MGKTRPAFLFGVGSLVCLASGFHGALPGSPDCGHFRVGILRRRKFPPCAHLASREEGERSLSPSSPRFRYFATCARGLEGVLKSELSGPLVRAEAVKGSGRGVSFEGDAGVGYRATLWSRTALKVMSLLSEGDEILDRDALYDFVSSSVDWNSLMREDDTLSVDSTYAGPPPDDLSHSHFTALTVKNAVVDGFRDKSGIRPSVDTRNPAVPLCIHLEKGSAKLYRCLSGAESLHKRGYRRVMHAASLKETTAAGLLLISGWDPSSQSLVDPMCGSGTLVIEAALMSKRVAPGLISLGYHGTACEKGAYAYPFSRWLDFDAEAWREALAEAQEMVLPAPQVPIWANDWHEGALQLAYEDASAAGVSDFILFFNEDAGDFVVPEKPDLVVCNPPWDLRLREAEESWDSLLYFLKQQAREAWLLSGNPELQSFLRLRAEQYATLIQGGMQLRWLNYLMRPPEERRRDPGGGRRGRQGDRRSRRKDISGASRRARW